LKRLEDTKQRRKYISNQKEDDKQKEHDKLCRRHFVAVIQRLQTALNKYNQLSQPHFGHYDQVFLYLNYSTYVVFHLV